MINLLPPDLRAEYSAARLNTKIRNYIVFVLVVFVLCLEIFIYGLLAIRTETRATQARLEYNTQQVKQMEAVSKEAVQLSSKASSINKILNQRISFVDLIGKIATSTPSGAYLTQLNVDSQNIDKQPVSLVFKVKSQQIAAVLRNNLDSVSVFNTVEIQSVVKSDNSSSDDTVSKNYPFEVILNAHLDKSKLGNNKL